MNTVGDNSAKVVGLFVFMLILVLLIVAIDNKTVRLLTSIVLAISLVFTVAFMILTKKKNILDKIPTYEERRTIYTMDEGFVIKKAEQSQTSSGERLNPREEFKELLKKILLLIKKNIVADSVAFYWANEDKKQMVFEEGITDLRFNFVRRYNWDDDALTTVARTGVPKVIGDINSSGSGDVIKYQSPRVESKSLLVFPVFYRNKTVGVILLDSHQAQTFSDDDVKNVELFSELISDLIGNYITKFDLYHKAKILEVISGIEKFDLGDLLERIQNFAIKVLDCSAVAIVLFEEGKWVVAHGYSKLGKYVEAGTEVKIEGTLVGEVIVSGIPKVIPSTRTQGKVYRFTENEKINLESSIAVVPIRYGQKCYGAMLFEHPKLYFFSSHSEIKKLETLANLVGMLLENENLNEVIESYFIYDEETLLMKKNYFYSRLNTEISRKAKHGGELTLVLISVDNVDYIKSTYGDESVKVIQPRIAEIVRSNLNSYDLAGKLDDDLIGVALVETGPNDAYIWAEKLRRIISNQEIKFEDKSFSVTVTIGVSAWDGERSADNFVEKVKRNFLKVLQNSENVVKVF